MANLRIGFANKFFTLWSIREEKTYTTDSYGKHHCTGHKTYYDYLGKLAVDESKAIQVAKSKGCTNLVPDEGLKGQRRSFSDFKAIKIEEGCFRHGRNKGEPIASCTDIGSLVYYGRSFPNEVIDRINELEPNKYVVYEGIVKTIEEAKADQLLSSIWDGIMSGKIELRAVSNFSMDGEACVKAHIQEETDDYFDFNNRAPYGIRFCFDSENLPFRLEERWYNGFRYWTPEGKRSFKGTKFRIVNNKLVLS